MRFLVSFYNAFSAANWFQWERVNFVVTFPPPQKKASVLCRAQLAARFHWVSDGAVCLSKWQQHVGGVIAQRSLSCNHSTHGSYASARAAKVRRVKMKQVWALACSTTSKHKLPWAEGKSPLSLVDGARRGWRWINETKSPQSAFSISVNTGVERTFRFNSLIFNSHTQPSWERRQLIKVTKRGNFLMTAEIFRSLQRTI